MRPLTVGVDLDGVCYPFDRALAHYVSKSTGRPLDSLPSPSSWDVWRVWGMSEDEFLGHMRDGIAAGFLFRYGAPYPGVVSALTRLAAAGHVLHVVTDRGRGGLAAIAARSTRRWLADHRIPFHRLTLTADKTSVPTDTFVEDRDRNFEALESAGRHPFLIDRPWNAHLDVPDGRRLPDLPAFAAAVEQLAAA